MRKDWHSPRTCAEQWAVKVGLSHTALFKLPADPVAGKRRPVDPQPFDVADHDTFKVHGKGTKPQALNPEHFVGVACFLYTVKLFR